MRTWIPTSLLLASAPALAGGYSVDAELLQPVFSAGELPGLDGALAGPRWSARAGLLYGYTTDPVRLTLDGETLGSPVRARATLTAGGSLELGRGLTARVAMPVARQAGDDDTGLAADGVGLGDARLGLRALTPAGGPVQVGLSGELFLPVGTKNAWLGESAPRGRALLVSRAELGPATLLLDAGALIRAPVDTGLDLALGSELQLNGGLRLGRRRLSGWAVGIGRLALGDSTLEGRAALEGMAGAQLWALDRLRLDLGLGMGLSRGLGSSERRALVGLSWGRRVEPPRRVRSSPVDPLADADWIPDERPAVRVSEEVEAPELAPEPVWEEGELARVRVERAQIEIREPIQFEFGTDRVLPESIPTLRAVAAILAEHPEIEALVIEGHASEEGSHAYNYDLAYRRAGAVFRELVTAGVHPYRLSTRSMGEVVPLGPELDEASLAANRRVEFHIVRQRHPLEPGEPLDERVHQPWDGAPLATLPTPEVQP